MVKLLWNWGNLSRYIFTKQAEMSLQSLLSDIEVKTQMKSNDGGRLLSKKAVVAFLPNHTFCQFNLSMRNRSDDLVQLQPAIIS